MRTGATALAALALAMGPRAADAMTSTHALPEGVAPSLRFDAPAHVAAKEKVEGIALEKNNDSGTPVVRITLGQEHPACLATRVGTGNEGTPTDSVYEYQKSGILLVRSDRILGGATPTLEERAIAVDAGTLGAKVLATRRVPLAVVARGPGDLAGYAARTHDGILVVVAGGTRASLRDDRGALTTNGCMLQRFLLKDEPETPGTPLARAVHLMTTVMVEHKVEPGPFGKPPEPTKDSRFVSVAVSLSRGSRDPEPILSMAIGYADASAAVAPVPSQMLLE